MKPIKLVVRAMGPYAGEVVLDFEELRDRTLFLIHGPTGSGKTTILDAVTFALYGECSGPERDVKRIRSDLSDSQTPTEVIFEFRLGTERYRIHRRPEQERPRLRGPGSAKIRPEATLTRLAENPGNGNPGTVVASQWSKVTRAVEDLLGFRGDQFRQVVVLPQGQFRKLLLADSKERQAILEVLFQTELYRRVEEALKQASKAIEVQVRDLGNRLKFILDQAESETIGDLKDLETRTYEQLSDVQKDIEILKAQEIDIQQKLTEARRTAERLAELADADRALADLERRIPVYHSKSGALSRAKRAATLMSEERSLERSIQESAKASERLKTARAAFVKGKLTAEEAEQNLEAEKERAGEREEARRTLGRLADLAGRVKDLERAVRRSEVARRALSSKGRDLAQATSRLEACAEKIGQNKELLRDVERVADQRELLQHKVAHAETVERNSRRLQELVQGEASLRYALDGAEKHLNKAVQAVDRAVSELEALDRAWVEGQAAVLAHRLEPGLPCPVCGSTDHPAPAVVGHDIPSDRSLKAKKARVAELQQEVENIRAEKTDLERRIAEVAATSTVLRETLGGEIRDQKETESELARLKKELKKADAAHKDLMRLSEETAGLREDFERFREERDRIEQEHQAAMINSQAAEAEVAALQRGIPENLRKQSALRQAVEREQTRLESLEAAWEAAQEALSLSREEQASRTTALTTAEESAAEAARSVLEHQEFFLKTIRDAGFTDVDDFRSAKKGPKEMDLLEQEIQTFHTSLESARERLARAKEAAKGLVPPDLKGIEKTAHEAKEHLQTALQREATLAESFKRVAKLAADYESCSRELAHEETRYSVVGRISEVANGHNPVGITFQRFVLGALLDRVLVAASERLEIMSNRRYSLQRQSERADRRTSGGLDLEVVDSYTGRERPVSTLSGGESFLASLSLALGLADVVQSYSGGIRLDTIFVDEGFGSLDPEALDLAFRALVDLQSGGRLVGVISHVPDLRDRIDTRLEIVPDKRGSKARFVIG